MWKAGWWTACLASSLMLYSGCSSEDSKEVGLTYQGSGRLALGDRLQAGDVTVIAEEGDLWAPIHVWVSPTALPAPLPEGIQPVGIPLDIHVNHPNRINAPLRIELTYDGEVPDDDLLVLHHDQARGWEPATILDHDPESNLIVFESRVFSAFSMGRILWDWYKGEHMGFEDPRDAYWINFDPDENGWPHRSQSRHYNLGMSAYALWFFEERYWEELSDKYERPSIARMVSFRTYLAHDGILKVNVPQNRSNLGKVLKRTLRAARKPLLLVMQSDSYRNVALVYGYDPERFYLYDPRFPGMERTVEFDGEKFAPYDDGDTQWEVSHFISRASLGRSEDFERLTREAEEAFVHSPKITLESPVEGETLSSDLVWLRGSISDMGPNVLLYFGLIPSSFESSFGLEKVHEGGRSFDFSQLLVPSQESEFVLLALTDEMDRSNWHLNSAVLFRSVRVKPDAECQDLNRLDLCTGADWKYVKGQMARQSLQDYDCGSSSPSAQSGQIGPEAITPLFNHPDAVAAEIYLHARPDIDGETLDQSSYSLFLLEGGCGPGMCIQTGKEFIRIEMDAGKDYYLAIDSTKTSRNTPAFEIVVFCEYEDRDPPCTLNVPRTEIDCQTDLIYGDTRLGPRNHSEYPSCYLGMDESGPESLYVFKPDHDGSIVLCLWEEEPAEGLETAFDLDIFALKDGCDTSTCEASADRCIDFTFEEGDEWIIVVDGFEGASGTFSLTKECR